MVLIHGLAHIKILAFLKFCARFGSRPRGFATIMSAWREEAADPILAWINFDHLEYLSTEFLGMERGCWIWVMMAPVHQYFFLGLIEQRVPSAAIAWSTISDSLWGYLVTSKLLKEYLPCELWQHSGNWHKHQSRYHGWRLKYEPKTLVGSLRPSGVPPTRVRAILPTLDVHWQEDAFKRHVTNASEFKLRCGSERQVTTIKNFSLLFLVRWRPFKFVGQS